MDKASTSEAGSIPMSGQAEDFRKLAFAPAWRSALEGMVWQKSKQVRFGLNFVIPTKVLFQTFLVF